VSSDALLTGFHVSNCLDRLRELVTFGSSYHAGAQPRLPPEIQKMIVKLQRTHIIILVGNQRLAGIEDCWLGGLATIVAITT